MKNIFLSFFILTLLASCSVDSELDGLASNDLNHQEVKADTQEEASKLLCHKTVFTGTPYYGSESDFYTIQNALQQGIELAYGCNTIYNSTDYASYNAWINWNLQVEAVGSSSTLFKIWLEPTTLYCINCDTSFSHLLCDYMGGYLNVTTYQGGHLKRIKMRPGLIEVKVSLDKLVNPIFLC